MSIKFKKLNKDDIAEYKRLRLEALLNDAVSFGSNFETESRYEDEQFIKKMMANDDCYVLGAFDEEILVSMVGIKRGIKDMPENEAHIWGVYTLADFRGRGLSKRLLSRTIADMVALNNVCVIKLGVTPKSLAAIGLYEAIGFKEYKQDNACAAIACEITMQLDL